MNDFVGVTTKEAIENLRKAAEMEKRIFTDGKGDFDYVDTEGLLNDFIAVGQHDKIFPLFNRKDLAKRWGYHDKAGMITYIFKNHENAPKPINEIFESVPYREYYPYFEVLRYERETRKKNI